MFKIKTLIDKHFTILHKHLRHNNRYNATACLHKETVAGLNSSEFILTETPSYPHDW